MLALSRKLCPFFSLIFMMSCGKKMNEPKAETKPHIENQEPSPTLILAIETLAKIYDPARSGNFKLPDRLRVRSNNAAGKTVTITYNILPEDPAYFEFKCIYKGASEISMPVEKCVDMEGKDVGDITDGRSNPIDHDKLIKLESSSEDLKADAIYEVDWM